MADCRWCPTLECGDTAPVMVGGEMCGGVRLLAHHTTSDWAPWHHQWLPGTSTGTTAADPDNMNPGWALLLLLQVQSHFTAAAARLAGQPGREE